MCGPGGILQDKRNLKSSSDSPSFMLVACDCPCLTHPAGDLYHGKDFLFVLSIGLGVNVFSPPIIECPSNPSIVTLSPFNKVEFALIDPTKSCDPRLMIASSSDDDGIPMGVTKYGFIDPEISAFPDFSFFRFCPRLPDTLACSEKFDSLTIFELYRPLSSTE